jgi:hypothetical protein
MDINTDQWLPSVVLSIKDATGADAKVDGIPTWATSDATIITVAPTADGMGASISTVAPGTARVTVSADADLGVGVKTLTGVSDDIIVTLGPSHVASVMTLTLGTPADKVAPAPAAPVAPAA